MKENSPEARERILEAAGKVFSERGFKAATVREICRQAKVGLGSVNYYFRDKDGLYLAVLEGLLSRRFDRFPMDDCLDASLTPRQRLRLFVYYFLQRLGGGESAVDGRGRLLAREIAEPSPVMDQLIERFLNPQKEMLLSIVRDLLGPAATPRNVHFCALSVAGQCLHYFYARPVISRLGMILAPGERTLEEIADHITRFSLGGLERVRKGGAVS
jgi:AcrR family transcriptional regulator